MTAQEYILSELKKLKNPVKVQDIGDTPLEEAIMVRVMSKKFRKLKVDQETVDFVKESIHIAIKEDGPLSIGCVQGGSKLWHSDEYPEVDWAELFNMIYYTKWMRYIAEVYKPGVVLEYFSMDVAQERLNNLPRSETDKYTESFKNTIEWLKSYLPDNIDITYRRYSDAYNDLSEYDTELDVAMKKTLSEHGGKLPVLDDAQKYMVDLHTKTSDEQMKDPEWREKTYLMLMSTETTKAMIEYINDKRYVPVCPTPWPGVIATGSTKKSFAKFWIGAGALEKSGDRFYEIILTPKQLKTAKFKWQDVDIGLKGKNFSKIRIVND